MQRRKPKKAGSVDIEVGALLRDLRSERNLSQRSLGHLIGVTFQQVQKYEKGTNRITVARLAEICKVMGVGYDYFLPGSAISAQPGLADNLTPRLCAIQGEVEHELLRAFRKVTSIRKRKAILELVQEMADDRGDGRS